MGVLFLNLQNNLTEYRKGAILSSAQQSWLYKNGPFFCLPLKLYHIENSQAFCSGIWTIGFVYGFLTTLSHGLRCVLVFVVTYVFLRAKFCPATFVILDIVLTVGYFVFDFSSVLVPSIYSSFNEFCSRSHGILLECLWRELKKPKVGNTE